MADDRKDLASDFFVEAAERAYVSAQRDAASAAAPKRFYKQANFGPAEGGFAVFLDGKPVRTPARRPLAPPTAALAAALADEWAAQGEHIAASSMPLTRLANSALDGVADAMDAVEADVVKYAGSDLICYRAGQPERLVSAQRAVWDGLVEFARARLGARLTLVEGVMFVEQPPEALAAIGRAVREFVGAGPEAPFRLAALHMLTTASGSCIVALAVALGARTAEEGYEAASVDETFQLSLWGEDAEARAQLERRRTLMQAAARLLTLVA